MRTRCGQSCRSSLAGCRRLRSRWWRCRSIWGKDQAAAWYAQGTPDGTRPGRVNINEYNFAERALAPIEAVAYHEGIPGHHLQISIAQELTSLPEFRRHLGYIAFVEGWALYSERLGKEIGFYQESGERLWPSRG